MSRFVLLRHECPPDYPRPSHWDLMLELGESLATWELRKLPAFWAQSLRLEFCAAANAVSATQLPDHRIAYLEREGPLSGGRGEVARCDAGDFELLTRQTNLYEFDLQGAKIHGKVKLACTGADWRLEVFSPPSRRRGST